MWFSVKSLTFHKPLCKNPITQKCTYNFSPCPHFYGAEKILLILVYVRFSDLAHFSSSMASSLLTTTKPPLPSKLFLSKTHRRISPNHKVPTIIFPKKSLPNPNALATFQTSPHLKPPRASSSSLSYSSSGGLLDTAEENDTDIIITASFDHQRPVKFAFWVLFWASLSLLWFATSKDANAAADSIKASSFGLKIANALRGSGWPDEAVVFALATLPLLELRGAIPVGYWMQLKPIVLTVLSVLG